MFPQFSHLKGKKVLVTSSASQAADEILRLENAGAYPIHIPLIEIAAPSDNFAALDAAIKDLDSYSWIIFTSNNGVAAFFERLSGRAVPKLKIAAVGPATAEKIEERGLRVSLIPARHDAEGLLAAMLPLAKPEVRVLWLRAREGRDVLSNGFDKAGVKLDAVEAYQNIMPRDIDRARFCSIVDGNEIQAVLFSSPSAVKNFVEICGEDRARLFFSEAESIPIGDATSSEIGRIFIPRPGGS